MQAKAKIMGFYRGSRIRPGQVFTLTDPKHFSDKWMIKANEPMPTPPPIFSALIPVNEPETLKEMSDMAIADSKKVRK